MRRTVAALASVMIVAGLALSPARATGPVFHPHVRVGSGATEPGVHIGPTGTVFVDGPAGLGSHSLLWRSLDGGASFAQVQFGTGMNRLPGGGDSDVAIRGNRVYYLDLWAGSNSISVSEDNGSTWTRGTPLTTLPLSDRQWIALGRPDPATGMDTVYVLYALIQEPRQVMIARSRTGGLTWESHIPAPGVFAARGFTGQLVSDGDKFLAFTWEDGGVLRAAYSSDEGETWGTSDPIATNVTSLIPGAALDGDVMHAAWVDRGTFKIRTASSLDRGKTWSAPITVSTADSTNTFPWIDARDGKVALAWYALDGIVEDPNDVPATSNWVTRYVESLDGGTTWSSPVDVGPGKTGPICTRGLDCSLGGGNRELGDFLSVVIGPDGKSYIAFGGRVGSGVKLAKQAS